MPFFSKGLKMKKSVSVLVLILFAASAGFSQEIAKLTLAECVDIALQKNPQIMQAEFSYEMSGKDVTVARANFMPSVSADVGYNHSTVGPSSQMRIDTRTGIPVPLQPNEINSWSSSASVSVNQTLFNGGYNYQNYMQSQNMKKSAEFSLESTKQNIIYLVKERYFNLLKRLELLKVQQKSLESAEQSYKLAQVMFEVGKVPKSDVLMAVVQKNEAELAMIETENLLSIARSSLNHVLGFEVDKVIEVADNLEIPELGLTYENAAEMSMSYNPALLKSQFDLKASQNYIGMAVSRYLPSVSAYAGYSWRNEKFSKIADMFDQDYNWYTGVSLSIPIFQGFSRIANHSRARLNYKYSQEILDQTQKDIALEVKEAYFLAKQAKRKITMTEDGIKSAEANLELAAEKYKLGSGTMLDQINAQVSNTQAQSNYIQALYEYKLGLARLEKAMGQLKK